MTTINAYLAAVTADDRWHAELVRIYGRRNAANVRYTKAASGEPGSNLRYLYDARQAAREAWERGAFGRMA
jgi:hypothetical protein